MSTVMHNTPTQLAISMPPDAEGRPTIERIHHVIKMLATATFRPFTAADYLGYAGAEGEQPLIAETDEFTAVIDDNGITIDYPEPFDDADCSPAGPIG